MILNLKFHQIRKLLVVTDGTQTFIADSVSINQFNRPQCTLADTEPLDGITVHVKNQDSMKICRTISPNPPKAYIQIVRKENQTVNILHLDMGYCTIHHCTDSAATTETKLQKPTLSHCG